MPYQNIYFISYPNEKIYENILLFNIACTVPHNEIDIVGKIFFSSACTVPLIHRWNQIITETLFF